MNPSAALRFWKGPVASLGLLITALASAQTPAKLDPPAKPTVTGKFTGNGKAAAIKFVTVAEHEPFSGKEAVTLIFSEKDASASKRPSMDAMFGKLGSSLTLSVFREDGGIFGCEVSHSAHAKRGFSSLGSIKMEDFKCAGGNVSGHVITGKELDTFGEKWEVDLTFAAPLPDKLRNAPPTPAPAPKSVAGEEPAKPAKEEPKRGAGPVIPVQKLPLPKDATNVEFKSTVEQIQLSSPRPVDAVAKELAANLKQQGWKEGAGSLIGKTNAILKREQGDAKLTIFVQPAAPGSTVKILTEGLDWSGTPSSVAPKKAASEPSAKDIEDEANKAIKDALKNLPKGL